MVQLKRIGRTLGMPIVAGGGVPALGPFGPEEFDDFNLISGGDNIFSEDFNDMNVISGGASIFSEDYDDFT